MKPESDAVLNRAGERSSGADPSRPGFPGIFREKELWVLVSAGILYFFRPLFLGQTFFYRDLYLWSYPQRQRLAEFVRAGVVPLWDPYIHGGQPFLGNEHNMALYPSSAFALLFPGVTGFNLEIVVHFLLCAVSAYLLARVVGLRPLPSFVAGSIYAFCGFTLSLGNLLNRLLAMPHYPLLVLFWHLFLLERRRRWFIAATAASSLQLLAGSPEEALTSLLVALLWGSAIRTPPLLSRWSAGFSSPCSSGPRSPASRRCSSFRPERWFSNPPGLSFDSSPPSPSGR